MPKGSVRYRNSCYPLKTGKLSSLQVLHIQHQAAHSNCCQFSQNAVSIYPNKKTFHLANTFQHPGLQVCRSIKATFVPPPWTPFEGSPPQRAGRLPGQCQAANLPFLHPLFGMIQKCCRSCRHPKRRQYQLTGGPSYMPPKAPHPHETSSAAHQNSTTCQTLLITSSKGWNQANQNRCQVKKASTLDSFGLDFQQVPIPIRCSH